MQEDCGHTHRRSDRHRRYRNGRRACLGVGLAVLLAAGTFPAVAATATTPSQDSGATTTQTLPVVPTTAPVPVSVPTSAPAVPSAADSTGSAGKGAGGKNTTTSSKPATPVAATPFGDSSDKPVEVKADQAIELHQDEKAYVARGNASATRGDVSVYSKALIAYYREVPGGGNQVYRLVADGAVHIVAPAQQVWGDKAVYDVDRKLMVVTGENLRLETKNDVITARDTLEYYEERQLAVARGNAIATRGDKRMRADVLMGSFAKDAQNNLALERVDGSGDVVLTTPRDVVRGRQLVYTLKTEIAVLMGDVKITRGENHMEGDAAEMNMVTHVSRVLSSGKPVSGLLIPKQAQEAGPAAGSEGGNGSSMAGIAGGKPQGNNAAGNNMTGNSSADRKRKPAESTPTPRAPSSVAPQTNSTGQKEHR